jgi:hypothetical protein
MMIHSFHYPVTSILLFKVKMDGKSRVVGFGMVILVFVWTVDMALIFVYASKILCQLLLL